jgi:ionotropic kainate glutamate receptor 3/ionotropic kainate glutamate receptor 5
MGDPRSLVMGILEEMRQLKILNVVVLVDFNIRPHTLDLYTWFPYQEPSGKCEELQDIILWNQWDITKGRFLRNESLFPSKIPSNLRQCLIVASTLIFEPYVMPNTTDQLNITYEDGLEIMLFRFVTDAMNLRVNFRPPPSQNELWGQEVADGIWTGIRGDVTNGTADVAFSGMSLRSKVFQHMDGTKPYINGGIVWVVPCARKNPRWKSILLVFSSSTWFLITMAVFVSSIVMLCLEKFEFKRQENQNLSYGNITKCLTYAWAVLLGTAVPVVPRSDPLRLFFIFWVSYSLAVNTVFQTFVTSYLVDPGMHKQIKSFDEIHETGMKYGFYPGLDLALQDGSDWRAVEIMAHRKVCNDITDCLKAVYKSTDFATMTDRLRVSYLNTHTFLDKSGVPMLCTLDYDFIESYKTFLLTKGSHFLGHFNKFIEIALRAGLVGKWWKDIQVTSRIKAAAIRKYSPLHDYSVLLLTHLQGAYYVLLLGHCVAFISFLMEILYHKHYTKKSL